MTRREVLDWLDGPCPGGQGHEADGHRSRQGWKRQDCEACLVEEIMALTGGTAVLPEVVVPRREIVPCQCGALNLGDADMRRDDHGRWHRTKRCDV